MNRALWLLIGLRFRAWFRRLGANLQRPRGILLTFLVGALMLVWFGTLVFQAIMVSQKPLTATGSAWLERLGPFLLLLYCAWSVIGSPNQSPVQFTLPEVQFLFAGPFLRRQILIYKMLSHSLLTIPLAFFISLAARSVMGTWLGGWLGTVLILNFVQLFSAALSLLAHSLEQQAYSKFRQVVLWSILLGLVGSAAYGWWAGSGLQQPHVVLERWENSPVLQYGLLPLRSFFRVIASREFDAAFFGHLLLALGVEAVLVIVVVRLDTHYFETAAQAAERRAAMLERLRSGGLANAGGGTLLKQPTRRRRLPNPLWLVGVGPLVWRQILGAIRSHRVFFVFVVATLMSVAGPLLVLLNSGKADTPSTPWSLAGIGLMMSMMLSQTVAFDFRADLDRLEFLKTLPLSAWQIAVAQLLVPTLILSVYQTTITGIIYVIFGQIRFLLIAVAVFSWPLNFSLVAVENGFFLLYPTRMVPATPGDFSHAFRQMLLMIGKMLILSAIVLLASITGTIAFALSGGSWVVSGVSAYLPTAMVAAFTVPFITWAFERFDVARDTPP